MLCGLHVAGRPGPLPDPDDQPDLLCASSTAGQRKSHDRGVRVRVGGQHRGRPHDHPGAARPRCGACRKFGLLPRIENSDVRTSSPPTPARIDAWVDTGIHVQGRPEWIFVKVHTHGTQERDTDTLLGRNRCAAHSSTSQSRYNDGVKWQLHYVSARETYNIVKAAEAGRSGIPGNTATSSSRGPASRTSPSPQFRSPANRWDELPC